MTVNPWTMGSEFEKKAQIPSFCKARFMVTKIVPPKTGGIQDGLVAHLALIDYESEGEAIQVTKITEGPEGYVAEFPLGKHLILATKYRGPKFDFNFKNPTTGEWTRIGKEKFTLDFATDYLKSSVTDWDNLDDLEKASRIDDYFEKMYMFGLANDFGFDTTGESYETPKPGMVTSFYRRYESPKEGQRFGNVTATKWPNSKKFENEAGFPDIDGTFEMKDAVIAEAIITAFATTDKKSFDPTSDDIPF